ncbi:hypothetical protein FACS189449_08840 [Alphaproteobacteria bacterium]|nr:hypothetical protein FACS189449_08840 [Alphaproteobacteria bacterium]
MEVNKLIAACAVVVSVASFGIVEGAVEAGLGIPDVTDRTENPPLFKKGDPTSITIPAHPQSQITLEDGAVYIGETKPDVDGKPVPHGKGTVTYPNGDKYEGGWKDGDRDGRGMYIAADGNRYELDYVDGWSSRIRKITLQQRGDAMTGIGCLITDMAKGRCNTPMEITTKEIG